MRGQASADSGQTPKALTPTLSPLMRGEGVIRRWARRKPGRRINPFKGLWRNLRASADSGQSPKPLAPTLSPLMRGEGVIRRRARRKPGRRINPFKGLWRNLRASADSGQSPKPLTPTLSPLMRGEGELGVPLELNLFIISRRKPRLADERRAIRRGPFGGRVEARLRTPSADEGGKPVVAIEFAYDFHHPVDRLEVCARHGAGGDQQRLVETADLDRQKLLGRMRTAVRKNLLNDGAHSLLA